jgi:hypothetical protein
MHGHTQQQGMIYNKALTICLELIVLIR